MYRTRLKRDLGLFQVTAIGVGLILGAGIYVLIGEATATAGNAVWLSFLLASFVALFTGLSYAELSSMYPVAEAEYTYTEKVFGRGLAFFIGYMVILSAIISAATVGIGFAGYFDSLFEVNNLTFTATILILISSIFNYRSIKEAAWANVFLTFMGILGLIIIIVLGIGYVGEVNYMEMPYQFDGVLKATALVFFSFVGFESIAKLPEECRDPRKTIPRALLLSIAIVTILYILVALAAVSVLDWDLLAASQAPLATIAASVLGDKAFVFLSVIALCSTANTVLISLIAGSRALYGVSKTYSPLRVFSKVHKKRRTPHIAIFAVMFFAIMFCFIEEIALIAELTIFTLFLTFAIINLALVASRYKYPQIERPFRAPLNIGKFAIAPLLGFLSCLILTAQLEFPIVIGGTLLAITGLFIYWIIVRIEKKLQKS